MELLSILQKTKAETLAGFELPEEIMQKTYGPGKWSVRQILVHLADTEAILHERIRRVIAEGTQVIYAIDQDLWCEKLDYASYPLSLSKDLYVAHRNSVIYLYEKFYQKLGDTPFVHSKTGLRTLRDEFDKVGLHNASHLKQIELALSL